MKQGATTSLEYWDMSFSQNHCMMNHIEEWFFAQLGGITSTGDAYGSISIHPWIPADLAQADISLLSPRGEVRMSWNRTKATTDYHIIIPAGSTASVCLPVVRGLRLYESPRTTGSGSPRTRGAAVQELTSISSVSDVKYTDSLVTFTLGSGDYTFTMNGSTLTDDVPE